MPKLKAINRKKLVAFVLLIIRKGVRFIAINNGIDREKQAESDFTPFLNIILVGSLSSIEQWVECFNKKYYYVPADSLISNYHQVEYIAIYQSKKLFGEDAGVLYYGEVL